MAFDPVLYRTPITDQRTGGTSREWIKFFDQLTSGTYANSIYFTYPNFVKFNNNAANFDDGKIGNSLFAQGLNIIGINNDSTARKIQFWGSINQNENVLGNTWAGRNIFSDPANLVFGSNYQNWSPVIGAFGAMTVSGVAIFAAQYIRVGPMVHFSLNVAFNLGGTASDTLTVTLPISPVNSGVCVVTTGYYFPGAGNNEIGFGYVNSGSNIVTCLRSGSVNFPLVGGAQVFIAGTYRVA